MPILYLVLMMLHVFLILTATNPVSASLFAVALVCWTVCFCASLEED